MDHSPTEHFEHLEHAEHAAHSTDSFFALVSATIALLAVAAASVDSLESLESAAMISAKNDAVFLQNKETDQWNFYQAKRVKKAIYDIAAASGGPKAAAYAREVQRNANDSRKIEKAAQALEAAKNAKLRESNRHERGHHVLTIAVTLLHIAIAIATLAIITRGRRWPWYASIGLGFLGVLVAGWAYI